MQRTVLLGWLAALFAVMAAMLALTAVVVGWPVLLIAIPLAAVASLFYYHASGRLMARLRKQARQGGGRRRSEPGRTASTGPRGGRGGRRDPRWAQAGPGPGPRQGVDPSAAGGTGMSQDRARSILGLDPTADDEAVRAAYRRKVKETHPDRGGDEEAFKRVTTAYETLGGD